MKVTRFCSKEEYDKFINGDVLVNHTDHFRGGSGGSTSVGFCFTTEAPKKAWKWLKGIVDFDVCMVLDIDPKLLTASSGKYLDWNRHGLICYKREYCLQTYSNQNAKLVKVLQPEEFATQAEITAASMLKSMGDGFAVPDELMLLELIKANI